jgi:hypothetical protein
MKLIQRLRAFFGTKQAVSTPQIDPELLPSHPDFDVHAWLRRSRERREQSPDQPSIFWPSERGLRAGISDCVTPEEKADQERRLAELERQEEEAKRSQIAAG